MIYEMFRPFIISMVFTLMCVCLNAQTDKLQTVNIGKIAVVNFELIRDEKTGIKEIADIL